MRALKPELEEIIELNGYTFVDGDEIEYHTNLTCAIKEKVLISDDFNNINDYNKWIENNYNDITKVTVSIITSDDRYFKLNTINAFYKFMLKFD